MPNIDFAVHHDPTETETTPWELTLQKKPVFYGQWDFYIKLNGQKLKPTGLWQERYAVSSKHLEFIEWELTLDRGYRLARFFLLDEKNEILILCDTVSRHQTTGRPQMGRLDYESLLYCSPDLLPKEYDHSTECVVEVKESGRKKLLMRILPLALPEWKSDSIESDTTGSLHFDTENESVSMILQQQIRSDTIFCPIFMDLNPTRRKKPYTWRRLTIGEDMKPVPQSQAVAYRIQLGTEQYLLYRSTTHPANRTFLGHNLTDDLCYATFTPDQGVQPLLTVQYNSD